MARAMSPWRPTISSTCRHGEPPAEASGMATHLECLVEVFGVQLGELAHISQHRLALRDRGAAVHGEEGELAIGRALLDGRVGPVLEVDALVLEGEAAEEEGEANFLRHALDVEVDQVKRRRHAGG
eukprot:619950-Hanusia_phi.AAC.1